ncbi:N-acetyltransferase-like protein [Euroglyphus maynei]|uniref:RNA cytidine acetyltransferase n=1 Tax=Euroglyphus maynei TaxID=6958 RepID=A0A1Y3BKK0_EURMA|nr:N-acetyltransferase-like protein [Euroglyphus maynei]
MVIKKLDNRLRILIENGIATGHRTMFVIVGPKARDQVVILHQMLSKSQVKARPSVLWCYKKELGFSSHRKKRMRLLQKKIKSGVELDNLEDMFETFVAQTDIRYCYYKETHKILGNTYGMLILQDFEAITPNILARTIETVEGGGIVCILLNQITSLRQLYAMTMDVHTRYRTEAHQDVVARFNERFILSLSSCKQCVIVDDKLDIVPISSNLDEIVAIPRNESSSEFSSSSPPQLKELKESLKDTQPIGSIINVCRTLDQAQAVLKFIDVISEKTLSSTVSLTASRGRGKSAALGLAIAAAIAFNYSNIYVTSPSPENLKTLFEFILKGFDAVSLKEHLDYDIIQSTNEEFNKAIVRVNVYREHRQCIQYIHPTDAVKTNFLAQSAELLVIDEAAAIPLPIVKSLIGPYLVFMSSTINGYEGTGRSLSLKLLQQLRQQSRQSDRRPESRVLHELTLNESIRYKNGDDVEQWLNQLLCLDAANSVSNESDSTGCPLPADCQLYYINRDILFSYHKTSESFLQKIMALCVSSHYKNSPNDLQMMSDAPAHHLFCLLPPVTSKHVCLEGQICKDSIMASLSRGQRASGDLIPWTISQQFQDSHFASLSGVRIVRIATDPNHQKMGYGTRALQLLEHYYRGLHNVNLISDERNESDCEQNHDAIKKLDEPLLLDLKERKAEKLDYLGVSFGMTQELLRFWKKSGFIPVYLRQTPNELTGEHSCIMLKQLAVENDSIATNNWLQEFWIDFRRRFVSLLSYEFHKFSTTFALNILQNVSSDDAKVNTENLTKHELYVHISVYDIKRLELYAQNLVDYHLIVDLLPTIAKLYFSNRFDPSFHLSHVQNAILLGIGLQHKNIDAISEEFNIPATQILGLFSRSIKKMTNYFRSLSEKEIEKSLPMKNVGQTSLNPLGQSLDDELTEAEKLINDDERKRKKQLTKDLSQFAIKGNEDDWDRALKDSQKTLVSIKSLATTKTETMMRNEPRHKSNNKKHKKFKSR